MDAAGSGDTFRRPWRDRGCTCTCENGSDDDQEEDFGPVSWPFMKRIRTMKEEQMIGIPDSRPL